MEHSYKKESAKEETYYCAIFYFYNVLERSVTPLLSLTTSDYIQSA